MRMLPYKMGFLPVRSDSFPYSGPRDADARRYALFKGSDLSKWRHVAQGAPSNPAVVVPSPKLLDDRGQGGSDNGIIWC